jgi:hypothetical protein
MPMASEAVVKVRSDLFLFMPALFSILEGTERCVQCRLAKEPQAELELMKGMPGTPHMADSQGRIYVAEEEGFPRVVRYSVVKN